MWEKEKKVLVFKITPRPCASVGADISFVELYPVVSRSKNGSGCRSGCPPYGYPVSDATPPGYNSTKEISAPIRAARRGVFWKPELFFFFLITQLESAAGAVWLWDHKDKRHSMYDINFDGYKDVTITWNYSAVPAIAPLPAAGTYIFISEKDTWCIYPK